MNFLRVEPSSVAARAIECYWVAQDSDPTPVTQKIIPDGFTEIIFHFGDPYRIQLGGTWRKQSRSLLAPQIKTHFYLENTGRTEIVGIKLKPAAITHLFGLPMTGTANTVPSLRSVSVKGLATLEASVRQSNDPGKRVAAADAYFAERCREYPVNHPVDRAVESIFASKGMTTVAELCAQLSLGERQLEKLFSTYVGLSPKYLARIVRFGYIFQLIKDGRPDWAEVVYRAGYYDQSHFIRNFKAFTGEDPSAYLFAEKTLANFFMKK